MNKFIEWKIGPIPFDPSFLNDPVAKLTEWTPAKDGGHFFRTHKLTAIDSNRLEFRAFTGAILINLVLLFVGIGFLIVFYLYGLSFGESFFNIVTIIGWILGLTLALWGGFSLYFITIPIVFDKRMGCFWKGRKAPDHIINQRPLKHFVELEQIHALQLVSENCTEDKLTYESYELNLVLRDGRRIHVVDHGSRKKLREDARTLSGFLQKPLWDAILLRLIMEGLAQESQGSGPVN